MFGIGMGEMIVIMGIALVVIGPERFPEFAKVVMRTIRDIRGYVDDVKHELSEELRPIEKEVKSLSRYDPEDYIDSLTEAAWAGDEDEDDQEKDSGAAAGDAGTEADVPHGEDGVEESSTPDEGPETPESPDD